MKSLIEYINERGAAPSLPKFRRGSSNSVIPMNSILAYAVNGKVDIEKMFNALRREQFGDDYVICLVADAKNNEYIIDTENTYSFEKSDGGIIVNNDDEREIYNAETVAEAFLGIVVFDRKKFGK